MGAYHCEDFESGEYCSDIIENLWLSDCFSCGETCIWLYENLIWPPQQGGPPPNPDLPEDVQQDYVEASQILNLSPRGSAALLRLCVQKLCAHLEAEGNDINANIADLVKEGLDQQIQKALDVVRVVGNNAVHPGEMDLKDDHETASSLFDLVNLIAEQMISRRKHVEMMYERLPERAKKAIAARDKKKH
jgi:hypothetical protein